MKTSAAPTFAALLQQYFSTRLLVQRNASPNTVASYRDTFRLLLRHVESRTHRSAATLSLSDLDARVILGFRASGARPPLLDSQQKRPAGRIEVLLPLRGNSRPDATADRPTRAGHSEQAPRPPGTRLPASGRNEGIARGQRPLHKVGQTRPRSDRDALQHWGTSI